jgi:hypothetical protein
MLCIFIWRNLNYENLKMTASLLSIEDFKAWLNTIAEARLTDRQFGVSELARKAFVSVVPEYYVHQSHLWLFGSCSFLVYSV